jgi:HK97 family phage portal protein
MKVGMQMLAHGVMMKAPSNGLLSSLAQLLKPLYGEPPKRETRDYLFMFGENPRLNAPVHKIAEAVASSPWAVYSGQGDKRTALQNHQLVKLLKDPNPQPEWTGYLFMYLTEIYLDVVGEAFWLIEKGNGNTPLEMYIVPPHWVTDTPSVNRDYFTVQPMGNTASQPQTIKREDIVYFKIPDPLNPYGRGKGRAQAVGDELQTHEYMTKYAKTLFFNDARPSMVITAPGAHHTEIARLEQSVVNRMGDMNNANKPMVLPFQNGKIDVLNNSQRELDFSNSRKNLRDELNEHWFIPPELMGIVENSNRATIDAADYLFKSNIIAPRLRLIQDAIQTQLVWQFGKDLYFEFDNIVPEDKEFVLKRAETAFAKGAMTLNEYRNAMGLPDDPNGDVYYIQAGGAQSGVYVVSDPREINAMNVPPAPPEPMGDNNPPAVPQKSYITSTKGMGDSEKVKLWKGFDDAAEKHENAMRKAVAKFFNGQAERILAAFEQSAGKVAKDASEEDVTTFLESLIDWGDEEDDMMGIYQQFALLSGKEAVTTANDMFGFGISFDTIRPDMVNWARKYGAVRIKNIHDTTREAIRVQVSDGIAEGESIPEIKKRIQGVMDDASNRRATTIARTETHASVQRGSFMTYRYAEVEKKEWLSTDDSRTRRSHKEMDGEVVGMNDRFSNKLQHPGDSRGKAEEVINCRCALLPVLE